MKLQLYYDELAKAVARGWCHASNMNKELDSELVLDIVEEVLPVAYSMQMWAFAAGAAFGGAMIFCLRFA